MNDLVTNKGTYKYSHTNRHGIDMYDVGNGHMSKELIEKRDNILTKPLKLEDLKEQLKKKKTKKSKKEITGILTHIDSECQESIGCDYN
jgi:hypothetical protein